MRPLDHLALVTCCALGASALDATACAWGPEGHRITGEIAAAHLTDEAREAVATLLGAQTIADVANWADDARNQPRYEWTKPLHYVNVPRNATSVNLARDCETGECIIGAIRDFEKKLRDPATPQADRLDAIRFLIHFIGDIHQPMHVSYRDDLGGNRIDVSLFDDRETNLHRVWDTGLIRRRMTSDDPRDLAEELRASISPEWVRQWSRQLDSAAWANESLAITRRIYRELPRGGQLGQEYYDRNIGVVLERLAMAGVRIAATLNDVYSVPLSPDPEPDANEGSSDAAVFLRIVVGDACGPEGGRVVHALNTHESRLIEARVKRLWDDRDRPMLIEETVIVRPGEANQRRLGCTHVPAGREVRIFTWEIVSARFR